MNQPTVCSPTPAFLELATSLGIAFDEGDLERIERYLQHIREANERFNLTAVTDPALMWMRHVLDSLTLMPILTGASAHRVLDVGSGAGLPGIVLAIILPEVSFTLVESTGKKARFLIDCVRHLGLENTIVVHDRAETIGHDRHHFREQFDVVMARAVGRLPVLLELTVPFARVGGLVLAIKGEQASDEIIEAKQALHTLHASVIDTISNPTNTTIVIEKQRRTPRVYPRRPGEPKRAPL